jgi:phosphatidylglycerophosphate synthase
MASNLNPANAITASRFLALPIFLWAIAHGERQIATVALIACGFLDLFDGAVARALHCTTPFGEVFDAVADGVCYGAMMLILTVYGWVPWPPVAAILVLGLATFAGRAAYARRAGRTVNYRSYAMERLVAYAAFLVAFGCADFQVALFYWGFVAFMAVVVLHDSKRMLLDPVPAPAERPA